MRALQFGDIKPFMRRSESLAIRFENRSPKYSCICYAWGSNIRLGILLPVPDTTVLNELIIQTELFSQIRQTVGLPGTPTITQTINGTLRRKLILKVTQPGFISSAEGLVQIQDGPNMLEISSRPAEWVQTINLFAEHMK